MSLNIETVFLFVNDYEAIYFQLEIPTKYYLVWVMWCNSRAIVRASHMMKFRTKKRKTFVLSLYLTLYYFLLSFLFPCLPKRDNHWAESSYFLRQRFLSPDVLIYAAEYRQIHSSLENDNFGILNGY
jgi:hypothetical protein